MASARFWNNVEPGRWRHRVSFYKQGEERDGFGKITNGIVEVMKNVPADFTPARGSEQYELQKVQGRIPYKCYCRWCSALAEANSNWYIVYRGRKFAIESAIDVDLLGRILEIRCFESINKEDMPEGNDNPVLDSEEEVDDFYGL